jgi:hypothetical protein
VGVPRGYNISVPQRDLTKTNKPGFTFRIVMISIWAIEINLSIQFLNKFAKMVRESKAFESIQNCEQFDVPNLVGLSLNGLGRRSSPKL